MKPYFNRSFLLLIVLIFSTLNAVSNAELANLLDSCTKYLKLKRPDLVVQFNMRAEALAKEDSKIGYDTLYQIQSNYIWAFYAINRQDLRKQHLKKAIALIEEEQKKGNSHFISYLLSNANLAAVYNQNGEFDSARIHYQIAIDLAMENQDTVFMAGSLNNMGIFLSQQLGWDTAKSFFDRAIELLHLKVRHDSVLYCSIRDNLADYYLFQGDSAKAVEIIEFNLQHLNPSLHQAGEKLIRWGLKILPIYLDQGNYQSAKDLLMYLGDLVQRIEGEWHYKYRSQILDYESKLALVTKNASLLEETEDRRLAFLEEYLEFMIALNEGVVGRMREYESYWTDLELTSAEEEVIAAEKKVSRNRFFFLVTVLISIVIISLLVSNYRRRIKIKSRDNLLKVQELEIAELEKEKIRFELDHKSKDFSNLLMQNSLQGDWSKYLVERLQSIRKMKEAEGEEDLKALIMELRQKSGMYSKIYEVQQGMEEANSQFFSNLEKLYPNLTKAERETCGLIRMNMQAKEIALLRNISPASVRKLRQRIRQKMGLDATVDLYETIKSL